MERVIVIGVNREGESFAACLRFKNEKQLEQDVYYRFECDDFIVFYEEGIDDLETAVEDFYAAPQGRANLDPEDRRTIRQMMESGTFKQKEVAANFGVSRQTVWRICNE